MVLNFEIYGSKGIFAWFVMTKEFCKGQLSIFIAVQPMQDIDDGFLRKIVVTEDRC